MATYNNQHWLLSHIRNSFISTDDTGMCETVMLSDDLPNQFLQKFQGVSERTQHHYLHRKSTGSVGSGIVAGAGSSLSKNNTRPPDPPHQQLTEVDFMCYPGLDQSDDEDMDPTSHSFDIQMYPEMSAHRFRSNTAQKLEKMDIAKRRAARTKCINFDEAVAIPERSDLFERKKLPKITPKTMPIEGSKDTDEDIDDNSTITSQLTLQLVNSPKQAQNKFMEYARFDGTSQTGIQTKRINVFLSMLPAKDRDYPMKICVVATAKIIEVIGLICYKCMIQYPDVPLKSIRHYGLYLTEDNDDMEDFPPLDLKEPCSKFGFSHLTLAERRPLAHVTRIDYQSLSMTSEDEKMGAAGVRDVHESGTNLATYEERMISHNDMIEAPLYRTYRLNIVDKRFFKTEVQLGISGERIEIDQQKHAKFWTKHKAMTYSIDMIAYCEIIERRNQKAVLRMWIKQTPSATPSPSSSAATAVDPKIGDATSATATDIGMTLTHFPTSPGHFTGISSPFAFFSTSSASGVAAGSHQHHPMRFKHFDFETEVNVAQHILNKMNFILDVRSSDTRREFLNIRERKREKQQAKKLQKT